VTISYATSLAFTKISILLFYLRLSPARWFRFLVWTLIAIVITYAVVYDVMSIFGCKPLAASWDLRLMPTAKCVDTFTKYMALSVLNIIIDIFTLILPMPVVVPLQMSIRQKISICAVFATGGLFVLPFVALSTFANVQHAVSAPSPFAAPRFSIPS
jgi:hypothetical protein